MGYLAWQIISSFGIKEIWHKCDTYPATLIVYEIAKDYQSLQRVQFDVRSSKLYSKSKSGFHRGLNGSRNMAQKLATLSEAIASVANGSVVALSVNTIHLAPCAAAHELIRQGKHGLELVKTSGAHDVDVLVGAGVADSVSAGFIGFENVFGLAPQYRRAAEEGRIQVKEHACYTVITAMRAA